MTEPAPTPPSRGDLVRWLAGLTRPVLPPLAGSTVFRWISQLSDLALFYLGVTGALGLATGEAVSLTGLALTMLGLSLVKGLARYLEQFLGHWVAFKALELLRTGLFARLWPQAPAVLSRSRSGDLLERATKDVDRLEVVFAHVAAPAITAVLTPLSAVLAIGSMVSWPVSAVMGLGLAISLVGVPAIGTRTGRQAAERTAATRARLTHSITDSVQGWSEVTGYGLAGARLAQAQALSGDLDTAERTVAGTAAARRGVALVGSLLTTLAVALVGLHTGVDVVLLAGALVVTLRCFDATSSVEDFLTAMDASFASAARLWQLSHQAPSVADPLTPQQLPATPLGVTWRNVSFTYPAGDGAPREAAVSNATAHAPAGARTCLVGASGSGKSTLAQLAVRFADPDEGAILIGGSDVRNLALDKLRSAVTYVSQRPFLFNQSVAANLRLADPEATDEDLANACRAARIHDHIASLPQGYDTSVGELAGRWSGGQRSRLALARALLRPSRVFILDEYNAHLDPQLAAQVADSLTRARPDATVIEITHRIANSLTADHVIVVDTGRVVQEGDPAELARVDGAYAQLLARDG